MEQNWRHLPPVARPIAAAAGAAVEAAQQHDSEALADAVAGLAALDAARTGLILGVAVRLLLEANHPDGIDAASIRDVLTHAVGSAGWQAEVDPHVMLLLLAGALGVSDEDDDTPPPKLDEWSRHAALLLADLLGTRPVRPLLTAALAEIEHTQLND
ncbi:hypothetical protein GCM10010172_22130 [Paractinoplanes ferrugineus]|uniref:Uncharacterized protein n=1 Tax=Paractinoplanes ferrugineus TaxID=113564 RepID=A0A919ITR0_9ACTN|nr:hypothetical protein [Actinoplanes ferrugineus]GIE08876.1 hypothetical protein Afe05nite_07160 [Actinoplanes ferrugineus]